jgi:transcriptional regulator GlxA family with amidase domain
MGDPERLLRGSRQAAYVRRVKAYLDTVPTGRVRIRDLADLAGVGPEQLRHAFKAHVDTAPIAYLNRARVARAAELLLGGRSPAQAATAVGFFDEPHLHRHFKRQTGQTPARYAQLHAKRTAGSGRSVGPRSYRHPGEGSAEAKATPR